MSRPSRISPGRMLLLAGLAGCSAVAPHRIGRACFEVELPSSEAAAAAVTTANAMDEQREYLPVHPLQPLANPTYPAEALSGDATDYVVHVRVTVDESGAVTEVVPNWRRVRLAHAHETAFLEAVRAAVRQWQLSPARWVTYRRTAGGENEYLHSEAVVETFEMKFSFAAMRASP